MHTQTNPRIEYVIAHLRAVMPRQWQEIAEKTGVPYSTISKIAYRDTTNPSSNTVEALHSFFEESEKPKQSSGSDNPQPPTNH